MSRYSATERTGVNAVEAIVVNELKWIFREQPIADMGIDAHVEMVEDGNPSGKLMGLQIKTGKGNFHETQDAYVYYGDCVHLDYWTNHSLPVILVGHIPETKETLWVQVNEGNVKRTEKGWKVALPKTAKLGPAIRNDLAKLFEGTPREQRLRQLAIHEPLMRHVESGWKVSVEIDDWYNKSLGRSNVVVYVYDDKGLETVEMEWMQYWTGMGIEEVIARLFPWSHAQIDQDFYDIHSEREPTVEDERDAAAYIDNFGEPGATNGAAGWYPYADNGETATYRLELTLNELGTSYLVVADYLDEDQ
ncbi:MAG: DUF4365 domain-containing protein [Burkholderiales bacterium]|nr:DUF4365 domain-containing protein [Burkholderiales bacterium]